MKYYILHEITDSKHRRTDATLYTDEEGKKLYNINHGSMISAPGPDGGVLFNTEIEGVVEAEDEDEAAVKLGVHPLLQDGETEE